RGDAGLGLCAELRAVLGEQDLGLERELHVGVGVLTTLVTALVFDDLLDVEDLGLRQGGAVGELQVGVVGVQLHGRGGGGFGARGDAGGVVGQGGGSRVEVAGGQHNGEGEDRPRLHVIRPCHGRSPRNLDGAAGERRHLEGDFGRIRRRRGELHEDGQACACLDRGEAGGGQCTAVGVP